MDIVAVHDISYGLSVITPTTAETAGYYSKELGKLDSKVSLSSISISNLLLIAKVSLYSIASGSEVNSAENPSSLILFQPLPK